MSFIHSVLLFSSTYSCRHVVVTPTHSPPSLRSKANDETTDELPLPIFDLCLFWHGHWNMRAGLYRRHMWHGWFGWLLGLLGWHCTRCILLLSAEFPHHKGKNNSISPYSFVPHKKNIYARAHAHKSASARTHAYKEEHTGTPTHTRIYRRTHANSILPLRPPNHLQTTCPNLHSHAHNTRFNTRAQSHTCAGRREAVF